MHPSRDPKTARNQPAHPAAHPKNAQEPTTEEIAPADPDDHPGGHHERDLVLPRQEANAASPFDASVTGEEDPGSALEYLVQKHRP